jgi:hypothetical protein
MKLPTVIKAAAVATVLGASSALAANLLLGPTPAFGTPVPNDGIALGVPVTSLDSGVILDDKLNFSARLVSAVYSGVSPLGGLTFTYTLANVPDLVGPPLTPVVNADLIALSIKFGDRGNIQVNSTPSPSGNVPDSALYTSQSLAFFWTTDRLAEGDTSATLVVHTSMKSWEEGIAGVIDTTTEDFPTLVPVPEPSTYAGMFALGLAGFAASRVDS